MWGGLLGPLVAGQEGDTGHSGGHGPAQTLQRGLGHVRAGWLLVAGNPRQNHVGLEHDGFELDALFGEGGEHAPDGGGRCLGAQIPAVPDGDTQMSGNL
jgi:hypothetical protein